MASSLTTYRKKRRFGVTSEPSPSAPAVRSSELRFMVHKHDATRLHYDLRLESDGVLGSWACPRGPSYDPKQKRLAVETEDHPLAYGDFEGRIPEGEYGAGDSLVWDRGTFDTVPPGEFKQQKEKGHLHVQLHGDKLEGGWHLVRTKQQRDKPQWLFFKAKDGTEKPGYDVIAERPESVKSGRKLTRGPLRKKIVGHQLPAGSLLERVWPPMLATLSELTAAPSESFVFEVKYDGYRALAALSGGHVEVRSRNKLDFAARFPFLQRAFESITVGSAVLDGEIVALDEHDRSAFQRLGDASATHQFVAFDLLWLDGEDLRSRPLEERRELLESVLANAKAPLVLAERVPGSTTEALAVAEKHGWEGLIAKRKGSAYVGVRGPDWLKLKRVGTSELAIVGWTPHSAGIDAVGALLLAVHRPSPNAVAPGGFGHGHFVFAGKVGTGFNERMRSKLLKLLGRDEIEKPDVEGAPRLRKAHWVKPKHVAQVRFSEWTRDGKLRHPSFLGLREDKRPDEARQEIPASDLGKGFFSGETTTRFGVWHSNREQVPLTHGDRVMFPKTGFTKADVRSYYEAVADVMVPALDGRPLSFQQWPQGIAKPGFFRHDARATPEWISKVKVAHAEKEISHLLVDRPETVMWLANRSIGFSLVNIPVSLSPAVREQDLHFHLLHDADSGRIREKRFCELDGKEVPYEHTIKGYEIDKHHTVSVTREELRSLDPKGDKTIGIESFVKLEEVDPVYFERTYYVYPEKQGGKAYALLHTVLKDTGRVGIARVVLSTKQHLCLIRVLGDALVLTTLAYDDEVAKAPKLDHPATSTKELGMAKALVEQLESPFEPAAYRDEHRERVLQLLQQKAKGQKLEVAVGPEEELVTGSLSEILERSLSHAKGKEHAPKRAARRLARPRTRAAAHH